MHVRLPPRATPSRGPDHSTNLRAEAPHGAHSSSRDDNPALTNPAAPALPAVSQSHHKERCTTTGVVIRGGGRVATWNATLEHIEPNNRPHYKKWYVVTAGLRVGIWNSWLDMEDYIDIPGQCFQSFTTSEDTDHHYALAKLGHVKINNINVYTSVDGRRLGKQTGSRLVAVNPAEHIFSKAQASDGSVAQSWGDNSVADVLGDFPVHDAEALQDWDSTDIQLAPKKRAKVCDWLPFCAKFLDELLHYEGWPEPMEDGSVVSCLLNVHGDLLLHQPKAVQVRFYECLNVQNDLTHEWCQLFQEGWFPATTLRLTTVFTFQLLDTFQELNLQGKTNLYDFWKSIECLTDNSGEDVYGRYKELSHVVRLWRHLVSLKCFGRAHDPDGLGKTKEGSLTFECPACPQPGKNLPVD
ncbi:hypothetical protein VTO73DRAFT_6435 [Trametes versicolor]